MHVNDLLHARGRQLPLIGLVSCLLLGAAPAAPGQDDHTHTLSKQYGSVLFRVMFQDMLYMVGRFDDYAGALRLNPDELGEARLSATMNMASLDMADADVAQTLVTSSSWFNTSLYPEASFETLRAEVVGDNQVDFIGELTFMGTTRPWTLHAELFDGGDGDLADGDLGMHATGTFRRTEFGLDQYLNMAADEVAIEVNVKFNRD